MELRASLGEGGIISFSVVVGYVTADVLEPPLHGNHAQDGIQSDVANMAKAEGGFPFPCFFLLANGYGGR